MRYHTDPGEVVINVPFVSGPIHSLMLLLNPETGGVIDLLQHGGKPVINKMIAAKSPSAPVIPGWRGSELNSRRGPTLKT